MIEPPTDQQIYAPPKADLGVENSSPSPRLRFWLACLWCLLFAPLLFYGLIGLKAPALAFPVVALVAWLTPLIWVLLAHIHLSGGRIKPARTTIVAVGLTIAMALSAIIGVAIATAFMVDPGFE